MSMLFKVPGPHLADGVMFEYIVVPDEQDDATTEAGWFKSLPEAAAAAEASNAPAPEVVSDDDPATRAELEQKATDLGLKFDGRTTDAKLAERIAEALKG